MPVGAEPCRRWSSSSPREGSEAGMTAGMGRAHRRVLGALAVAASWSAVLVGVAQPAAADTQSKQWYLSAMQAEEMWKVTTGKGIKVAVVDTGVNSSTPSLRGQVLKGVDVTGAPGDETDDYRGHGTTMAELIAGTGNGGGLKGLAPGAEIIPVRMSDVGFMSKRRTVIGDMKKAIRAAADSDAQIISVSMADALSNPEEHEAVKYAESKGKLVIAGVGNDGNKENRKQYPASYPEVVGVASADRTGKVSYYSQHSGSVDVASPEVTFPDGATTPSRATATATAAPAPPPPSPPPPPPSSGPSTPTGPPTRYSTSSSTRLAVTGRRARPATTSVTV